MAESQLNDNIKAIASSLCSHDIDDIIHAKGGFNYDAGHLLDTALLSVLQKQSMPISNYYPQNCTQKN